MHPVGFFAIAVFVVAYALVMGEEVLHLRKSKPVLIAAGVIWPRSLMFYSGMGDTHSAEKAVRHNILEFAELMLFLLVAMTYINAMEERRLFDRLRVTLVRSGMSLRTLFGSQAPCHLLSRQCRQPDDGTSHVRGGHGCGR